MKRKPLIIANWKMNHGVEDSIKFMAGFTKKKLPENVDVVICPPFTSLYTMGITLSEIKAVALGAQNCHAEASGAFTGEISANFLEEIECKYVLIGHSERRHIFNETDEFLQKKLIHVLHTSLIAVLCVGETESERDSGKTFDIIRKQLNVLTMEHTDELSRLVIAYEPVWAIGTGKTATPAQAQEVHHFIRKWVQEKFGLARAQELRLLYGGSAKPDNTRELMSQEDIDGLLVGGASLKADSFCDIIHCSV